jgi:hypothetical protein
MNLNQSVEWMRKCRHPEGVLAASRLYGHACLSFGDKNKTVAATDFDRYIVEISVIAKFAEETSLTEDEFFRVFLRAFSAKLAEAISCEDWQ